MKKLALYLLLFLTAPFLHGQANIGGLLFASNFAQWTVPQGNQGQMSWSSPSFCTVTSGGATFRAFTVGVPITLVDSETPANTEVITPTQANYSGFGCSISAHTVNPHNSFYFRTATAGLGEALAFAGTATYQVLLTPDWTRLGGQTSTITSATGNTSVTILDQRSAVIVPYVWGGSAYASQPFGGGGALPTGTKGQQVYYAANGTAGTAITEAVIVPPSGDTTGATDGVNVAAACTSTGAVRLTSGAYHAGASNTTVTLAAPCKIAGQGISTSWTNHGTTNDWFRISYYTDWSEGPWIYPASTNQTEISGINFAQSGTPTAGFIFDIGSGIAAGGGIFHYTMNVHIHDTVANGAWGGLKLIPDELYAFVDHNMWRQFVGGGAVLYSACLGSGDNHISDNEFSGLANSGIIITCSDTTMFAHDKLNGSGIKFTGANATKSVQFTDMSVETGDFSQACAYDFGTGLAPVNTQILGGEQYGFTTLFCHPSNAAGLAFSLANTLTTTDYPTAGLITNNGYTTVSFPPAVTYQDFASFAGTAATLLTAYTTASPGSGKTFTLYSAAAGTTIPQLNGSSAAYLPSGSDATFGDSLDTLTPSSANYSVGITCTKVAGSPTMGIFARASSGANTNYIVQYPTSASAFQLYSQVAGSFVLLGSSNLTWTNGTSHTMVLTVNGTTISATIDGATTIGPFTNSAVSATGQAGLRLTGGGNATCTNFYVQ